LLHRWNFTPHKPAFRAYEQNPREVRRWLQQQYPAIKRKAQRQHGTIFWLDEAGIRSQHHSGTTYAPKGKTPVIPATGQRFGVNIISAITNSGTLVFMVVDEKFNGVVFLRFLCKLIKSTMRKVFLIADRHPVHLENKVEQWLYHHQQKIELFCLPAYSPDLNPDEYFNQDLKSNMVGKTRPGNKKQLVATVEAFSNKKKRHPQQVINYFHAKAVNYAL
jgi:DDE superfamily endonuclease/Winged helix-turn helix